MVSGPGGVGKGTVVDELRRLRDDVVVSVSATTRPPRPGEVDGVHYHFLEDEAFDALVAEDGLLEWATFGGHRYGTPWSSVLAELDAGRVVVLEIEVQGALQVRERFHDALLVLLCPPDEAALVERLRERGTDSDARIAERVEIGRWEQAQSHRFDHIIINDDVTAAAAAIASILDDAPVS